MMKRREFIKTGLLSTVAAGVLGQSARADDALQVGATRRLSRCAGGNGCRTGSTGIQFQTRKPPRALQHVSWQNKLSGRTIPFATDSELDIDLDAAEDRIWILGWKGTVSRCRDDRLQPGPRL